MEQTPPVFVDKKEIARRCMLSYRTVDRWRRIGRIPPPSPAFSAKRPRWHWPDVEAALKSPAK